MFQRGNIIYFTPFYFKNGNTAKNKYFVVLAVIEGKSIIASLPSSKDYVPVKEEREMGCIELPSANLNCFVIPAFIEATECGKSFNMSTYLYGHLIDDYEISDLESTYPIEGRDYKVWGKIKEELLNEILNCFKTSASVKNKYKRRL